MSRLECVSLSPLPPSTSPPPPPPPPLVLPLVLLTGLGSRQVSEGSAAPPNAHGAGSGPIQVCLQRHHQVHRQGKTHLKQSKPFTCILTYNIWAGQGR